MSWISAFSVFRQSTTTRSDPGLPSPIISLNIALHKPGPFLSQTRPLIKSASRYVAPERLNNEGFVQMINATKVRLVAIDEAHCISEWGHAFRPDYLKGEFLPKSPQPFFFSNTHTCREESLRLRSGVVNNSCEICKRGASRKGAVLDRDGM